MSTATLRLEPSSGFTLIELMVTVAIVAILATIAYPSYRNTVLKSHRTEAKSALLDLAGREERLYSTTSAYSAKGSDLGYSAAPGSTFTVGSGYYQVTLAVPAPAAGALPTFSIKAVPIGAQTADNTCTFLAVDQTGAETASDPSCWE